MRSGRRGPPETSFLPHPPSVPVTAMTAATVAATLPVRWWARPMGSLSSGVSPWTLAFSVGQSVEAAAETSGSRPETPPVRGCSSGSEEAVEACPSGEGRPSAHLQVVTQGGADDLRGRRVVGSGTLIEDPAQLGLEADGE